MPAAAAVDQERCERGADAGVAEALEDGLDLPAQVIQVHVVDEVVHRPEEAEGAGGLEGRAVLDVAPLEPVVPVHPHHASGPPGPTPVIISEQQTGVTEGKLETMSSIRFPRSASAANVGASPESIACRSIGGVHGVNDDQYELLGHGDL